MVGFLNCVFGNGKKIRDWVVFLSFGNTQADAEQKTGRKRADLVEDSAERRGNGPCMLSELGAGFLGSFVGFGFQ